MKLKIFKKHYDLIIGFLVFVSYRFSLTYFLWHNRTIPPEPDDSYFYLSSATHAFRPESFEQFRLLPFSLWLNLIHVITGVNLEKAYLINFYLGPLVMFFAIFYFLKKTEPSRIKRFLLILVLALYSGSGAYHGFYWVVPSFYQLSIFFVILTFIFSEKKANPITIFLLSLLFIFIHPTSIFISSIFLFYLFLSFLFQREVFKKSLPNLIVIYLSIAIAYIAYFLIGKSFPNLDSPESFQNSFKLISDFLGGKLTPQSFPVIWKEYFAIFFFHPVSTIAYFLMIFSVFKLKKFKLLILFVSILILVLASSFLPYGSRTLGFLWPVTFLIMGYALIGVHTYLKANLPRLKLLTVPILGALIFTSTSFNLISTRSIGTKNNYDWNRQCPQKIKDGRAFFYSHEGMDAFITHGLTSSNVLFLSQDNLKSFLKEGSFIVSTQQQNQKSESLSRFEKFITDKISRRTIASGSPPVDIAWTKAPVSQSELENDLARNRLKMGKIYDCGYFQINIVSKQ